MVSTFAVMKLRKAGKSEEEITVALANDGLTRDAAIELQRQATIEMHHETLNRKEFLPILIGIVGWFASFGLMIGMSNMLSFDKAMLSLIILGAVLLLPLWFFYWRGIRHDHPRAKHAFIIHASFIAGGGYAGVIIAIILPSIVIFGWSLNTLGLLIISALAYFTSNIVQYHQKDMLNHHLLGKPPRNMRRHLIVACIATILFFTIMCATLVLLERAAIKQLDTEMRSSQQSAIELRDNKEIPLLIDSVTNAKMRHYLRDRYDSAHGRLMNPPQKQDISLSKVLFDDTGTIICDAYITPAIDAQTIVITGFAAQKFLTFKATQSSEPKIITQEEYTRALTTPAKNILSDASAGIESLPQQLRIDMVEKIVTCINTTLSTSSKIPFSPASVTDPQLFPPMLDSNDAEAQELTAYLVWLRQQPNTQSSSSS